MQNFAGKVSMVSGGGASIGAEIARSFARRGASVVIADIDDEGGEALASELGNGSIFVKTDLGSRDSVCTCVERATAHLGRIDFLVNSAGAYEDRGSETSWDEWSHSFDVNVIGPVMLALAARPLLSKNRGVIVNVGSISASVAQAGRWSYPASKAALAQATRSMALDFASDGIRVNAVSPGWTWSTGMEKLGLTREMVDEVAAPFHMMGKAGDRADVANAVLFLCSEEAGFITGANLPVDGGYTAMGPEGRPSAFAQLAARLGE